MVTLNDDDHCEIVDVQFHITADMVGPHYNNPEIQKALACLYLGIGYAKQTFLEMATALGATEKQVAAMFLVRDSALLGQASEFVNEGRTP